MRSCQKLRAPTRRWNCEKTAKHIETLFPPGRSVVLAVLQKRNTFQNFDRITNNRSIKSSGVKFDDMRPTPHCTLTQLQLMSDE